MHICPYEDSIISPPNTEKVGRREGMEVKWWDELAQGALYTFMEHHNEVLLYYYYCFGSTGV
jgi:hypothetical protein